MAEIDVAAVRTAAKKQWMAERRKALTIQEWVERLLPWSLVAMAAVFFGLSAPHTAAVFGLLTPVLGYLAPLGVEAGILYVSYRRKQLFLAKERVPTLVNVLVVFLAIISVIVNGAGTLDAVVSALNLGGLPFDVIWKDYPTLPIEAQAALLLVVFAALVIPLGTFVAGDGLASLFLEQREHGDWIDNEWQAVRTEVEYTALVNAYVNAGWKPSAAHRAAAGILRVSGIVSGVSDVSRRVSPEQQKVEKWMADNPIRAHENHRTLAPIIGVSESTVYRVQKRFSENGAKKPEETDERSANK